MTVFSRNLFASISHLPSLELEDQLLEIFRNESRSVQGVEGFSATSVTQPFFEGSVAAMKVRGGNPVSVEAGGPFTGEFPSSVVSLCADIHILDHQSSS